MLKRTLMFGSAGHLSLKNGQLFFRGKGDDKGSMIPLEDIGIVFLEHPALTVSLKAMQALNANGTALVVCDGTRHPDAMMLRFAGNTTHAESLRQQVAASAPLTRRLWRQVVRAKIRNQAELLHLCRRSARKAMLRAAENVKSGDSDNREGVAARLYWKNLFDAPGFTRDPDGGGLNDFLNYGYAVLRAASARALVGSGLYCALGIHHRNRYNAFSLADDFMEPYRPFVDRQVVELSREHGNEGLTKTSKATLLAVLASDVYMNNLRRPLMVALSLSSASLARCLAGTEKQIHYPVMQ